MIALRTPLAATGGLGPRFLAQLKRLGIETVRDLLWHFPTRYEDFSEIVPIAALEPGQHATIQGVIEDISMRRTWRRRMTIAEAVISDESGSIKVVWFNQPYLKNILRPGRVANFAGRVATSDEHELYLSHPTYEILSQGSDVPPEARLAKGGKGRVSETRHTARLVPVYPETQGLTSRGLRSLVQPVLKNIEPLGEWIPEEILRLHDLPDVNEALHNIHFPECIEDALASKRRFAFEDLFLLQLLNLEQKLTLAKEKAPIVKTDIEHLKRTLATLPFSLTLSQKKSLWEIIQDLAKPHPMNRLLQGDVGSGKTVVAALAALLTAEAGYATAIMAPTEVLAAQHFETVKRLFEGMQGTRQPATALLTRSTAKIFYETDVETEVKKSELAKNIKNGEVKVIIGTHALISPYGRSPEGRQKGVQFKNLGLVIIDEQHRFGVEQRAALVAKTGSSIPHFLSMSATPIPRTLMLTVFGDLDLSTITELPAGRKKIVTKVVAPENRGKAYGFIREQIKKGRQAFVICPRIEPTTDDQQLTTRSSVVRRKSLVAEWEIKSVKEEYEKLSKKIFPDMRVAMLHGQMPASPKARRGLAFRQRRGSPQAAGGKVSKEEVMKAFRDRKIDILVSTSVIEVGVDVPNATIMMIEGADRFGLAQLYQFRGRVGRSTHQSFCFLFTDSSGRRVSERLKAIAGAKNGFELAEIDLKLRGPGEFLGQKQTGFPDIAMAGLQDPELIQVARRTAGRLIEEGPYLARYPLLRAKLLEFKTRVHFE